MKSNQTLPTLTNAISGVNRTFSGGSLLQIAMPIGGIGSGNVCLNGQGGLQDFSLHQRPATTALPDNWDTIDAAFAILHIKGENGVTKLIEGPVSVEKVYDQGLQAQGYRKAGYEGLPRFRNCEFQAEYPFGEARLSDPAAPLAVRVVGWSPLIPGDDVSSSFPAAIMEYTFENTSSAPVDFEFSFHASHLALGAQGWTGTRNSILPEGGVLFTNTEDKYAETFGSAAILALGHTPRLKAEWYRGGWFDGISMLWREVSSGRFVEKPEQSRPGAGDRNGGSLLIELSLAPREQVTVPIVVAWHFPNVNLTVGQPAEECGADCNCDPVEIAPLWRPFYAGVWKDAAEVARAIHKDYVTLRLRTLAFKNALFSSSLPASALDAVSSNLAILKSPTVLRQENGNMWAWEGCFTTRGCCDGSCTHVWNYAQVLPHLFPKLERTLRGQELERSMNEQGHVNFRSALPDGPAIHNHHAASDGQLGGIMKLYRDWQIGGDTDWMSRHYPLAKRSLDYCIATWDPDHRGALSEPHHNTYDIEFWGPDGMCGSIYAGALSALSLMAGAVGATDDAAEYGALARKAAEFLDTELFNGEYYIQKVQWTGLRDQSFARVLESGELDPETDALYRAEGPKYQYGVGCLSDGVIGAWMASQYGVPLALDRSHVQSALRSIFRHNFRPDLSDHACTQRPGYAIGEEAGLLICSWPNGGKLSLPFPYSDEVWTGIEYQVASHLISEGFVEEGLTIVEAVRSRYEGHVRNPFNEYECGSYYARAMASYALLGALSGFRYSAVERTLYFGPKIDVRPFRTFFSAASGFGTITLAEDALTVEMVEGELAIERVVLTVGGKELEVACGVLARVGEPVSIRIGIDS